MAKAKKAQQQGTTTQAQQGTPPGENNGNDRPWPKKKECKVSRMFFRASAKPLSCTLAGTAIKVDVKEFSSGSLGWFYSGKVMVDINGTLTPVQVGLNMIVVGSKELPQDDQASE